MSATRYNINCEQGADLIFVVTYRDSAGVAINLTGGLARMQVRKSKNATAKILDIDSAAKGGITLGGATGTMSVEVSAVITSEIAVGEAVYDLEYVDADNRVVRVIEGRFNTKQQVTR